jgi:hypothetical protein
VVAASALKCVVMASAVKHMVTVVEHMVMAADVTQDELLLPSGLWAPCMPVL